MPRRSPGYWRPFMYLEYLPAHGQNIRWSWDGRLRVAHRSSKPEMVQGPLVTAGPSAGTTPVTSLDTQVSKSIAGSTRFASDSPVKTAFDVAVVGGGIVGLVTAYHLTQQYPDRRVVVLEKE